jgi:hypothetical protein
MHSPLVQAMAASWDSLCPDMREQVFAAVGLLDLGRAAPTCRDFRAAYKARLSAAHPAIVGKAVSSVGEAFLKAHSTVMSRLSRDLGPFAGEEYLGQDHFFYKWGDGTLTKQRPDCADGVAVGLCRRELWSQFLGPGLRYVSLQRPTGPKGMSLRAQCVLKSRALHIIAACDTTNCREAAGELAAVCKYILVEEGGSSSAGHGKALHLAGIATGS